MDIPPQHNAIQLGKIDGRQASSHTNALVSSHHPRDSATVPRADGPYDKPRQSMAGRANIQLLGPGHYHSGHVQMEHQNSTQIVPRQQARPAQDAVSDLLPYCTMMPPLNQAQVIALSDVAGSLKELALLALGAVTGDPHCVRKLEGAVGEHTAGSIAEFFMDEWEMDG
ncbi:hypothetical protein J1614_002751 [Plenodomus biglobosus]|nr:hypothetical protein J1614_002751 [Plenodomus biglobosus]